MEKIELLIGEKVKAARLKAKMSQSALASLAKTSLTTINRLEKGRQFPHSNTLTEIAKVLNISIKELYQGESTPEVAKDPVAEELKAIRAQLEQQNQDAAQWRAFKGKFDTLGADLLKELESIDIVKAEIIRAALGLPSVVLVDKPNASSEAQKNAASAHKKSTP